MWLITYRSNGTNFLGENIFLSFFRYQQHCHLIWHSSKHLTSTTHLLRMRMNTFWAKNNNVRISFEICCATKDMVCVFCWKKKELLVLKPEDVDFDHQWFRRDWEGSRRLGFQELQSKKIRLETQLQKRSRLLEKKT